VYINEKASQQGSLMNVIDKDMYGRMTPDKCVVCTACVRQCSV